MKLIERLAMFTIVAYALGLPGVLLLAGVIFALDRQPVRPQH